MQKDQAGEFTVDLEKAVGEGRLGFEPDDPPRHGGNGVPTHVDDPVPRPQRPRVNA